MDYDRNGIWYPACGSKSDRAGHKKKGYDLNGIWYPVYISKSDTNGARKKVTAIVAEQRFEMVPRDWISKMVSWLISIGTDDRQSCPT